MYWWLGGAISGAAGGIFQERSYKRNFLEKEKVERLVLFEFSS